MGDWAEILRHTPRLRQGILLCATGISAAGRSLLDLALPPACRACGADHPGPAALCPACQVELLALVARPYCLRCGSTVLAELDDDAGGCGGCPPVLGQFARVVRLGPYAHPLRGLIRQLKYRRSGAAGRQLADLLAQAVAARCEQDELDVVLAVPAHWRRRFSRGCDHSRMLASAVARRLKLPLGHELIRIRPTPPQTHLPRTRRILNVKGAFAVNDARSLAGARILLVDDVTTTGATADEAAATLLKAGASRVILAVAAKAEPPRAYRDATHADV